MKYKSTRGSKTLKSCTEAIIQGLAEDRGLYIPENIPALPFQLNEMVGKTYQEVALKIITSFFPDYSEEDIKHCIYSAYDSKFENPDIAKLSSKHGQAYFLELFHGKTAAFKDMALSILPYLLTTAMKVEKEDSKICILTATSGDTGKAALEGFADVPGTEILVFYPKSGVSQVQEKQMLSQEGNNVHVFSIIGNFDDAQTGVKKIFDDSELAETLKSKGWKLSSANSINIGRLVPQIAYYIYTYIKMLEHGNIESGDLINIVVPTGNFGNILAAYYAKKMGTPIGKLICASNENKVLTDFLKTGVYDIRRDFHLTNSPSMDILISSNLERLLYHLSNGDSEEISRLMKQLETDKHYEVSDKIKSHLSEFYAGFATVEDTQETIHSMYSEHNYLFDTHTAVAYKVYSDYVAETGDITPTVIASTASPYKFADSVADAIGLPKEGTGFEYLEALHRNTGVAVPKGLQGLAEKPILHKQTLEISEMKSAISDILK